MRIHPTAVVSPGVELGPGVEIGPYCLIGGTVTLGAETLVGGHVIIEGKTSMGERNRISPFCSLGSPPQDVGYRGEETRLVIGDDNVIREFVTINRATTKQDWQTTVGSNNYLMAYAHIAHDCVVGNHVIMANGATLGGHTGVGDYANLGAFMAAHQFVRIGAYAFLGAKSGVDRDIPPFMLTAGPRAKLYGINRKGLSRMGFPQDVIDGLKRAYSIIWIEKGPLQEAILKVRREVAPSPQLEMLLGFFEGSKRGVLR